MREYGKIFCAIWRSNDFRSMTEDGQKMAMYLLSSGHANLFGCYYLPHGYIAEDLGWDALPRLVSALDDCIAAGFAEFDNLSRFVYVTKWMEWQPFENPNVAKAAGKLIDQIPPVLRYRVAQDVLTLCAKHLGEELTAKFKAIEPPKVQPVTPAPAPVVLQAVTEQASSAKTRTPAVKAAETKAANVESKTAATWASYERAYKQRYDGTPPVRNAMVNSLLAKFVDRIGTEEAPLVAAFFVFHNKQFYVACGHAVNALLSNAETLRTEWFNGKTVTTQEAREADRRQSSTAFLARQLREQGSGDDELGGVVDMEPKQ
jgi:hypothetical protein